jgi:dihydroorotate dehydrogenase
VGVFISENLSFNEKHNYPMSLIPYALSRPFLFCMDAETAHEHTLNLLAKTQNTPAQWAYAQKQIADPVELAGLHFPNKVGLAAGLDKNARCIDAFAAMGFGFIEVGTVTPKGQTGNPKPRMFRLAKAKALINRLGFNNDGLDAFLENVQKSKSRQNNHSMLLGLNIGKNANTPIENAANDYLTCLAGVYPHADYVTVNISSPNTKNLRELQTDEALDALLKVLTQQREILALKHQKQVPVFIKIAPDLSEEQIALIASTLKKHCFTPDMTLQTAHWGVIATNTTISREAVQGLEHSEETGGLSGAPVLEKSNQVIRSLRHHLGDSFPIIGVGGILNGTDAQSKIDAGANVVQLYSGLIYKGPSLITEVARTLAQHR